VNGAVGGEHLDDPGGVALRAGPDEPQARVDAHLGGARTCLAWTLTAWPCSMALQTSTVVVPSWLLMITA